MKKILSYYVENTRFIKYRILIYIFLYILLSIISIVFPLCEGFVIDAVSSLNFSLFIIIIVLYGTLSILSMVLSLIVNKLNVYISNQVINHMVKENINHLFKISFNNLSGKDSMVITQELIQDNSEIHNFITQKSLSFISNVCLFVFAVLIILKHSFIMALFIVIILTVYMLSYLYFKKKVYLSSKRLKEKQSIYYSYFYKLSNFIKDIRLNSLLGKAFKIQDAHFNSLLNVSTKNQNVLNNQELCGGIINFVSQLFIFVYGFKLAVDREMSIGFIITISSYFSSILGYSQSFLSYFTSYQGAKFSYERINKRKSIPEIKYGHIKLDSIHTIRIEKLEFSFDKLPVFTDKNIFFKKGNIYCIKGKNGTGKTTLIDCIFGIFGYSYKGDIFFDDIDIRNINLPYVIDKNFSISQQIPYLIEGTIKENINLGGFVETGKLNQLLDGFGLRDIYTNKTEMMNSYNDALSGGEKQKISLIRTLLSSKSVLVFDEPFTYLDEASRKFLERKIDELKFDKIIIIISHDSIELNVKEIIM